MTYDALEHVRWMKGLRREQSKLKLLKVARELIDEVPDELSDEDAARVAFVARRLAEEWNADPEVVIADLAAEVLRQVGRGTDFDAALASAVEDLTQQRKRQNEEKKMGKVQDAIDRIDASGDPLAKGLKGLLVGELEKLAKDVTRDWYARGAADPAPSSPNQPGRSRNQGGEASNGMILATAARAMAPRLGRAASDVERMLQTEVDRRLGAGQDFGSSLEDSKAAVQSRILRGLA